MDHLISKINETSEFLRAEGMAEAETGIVLGTGLGAFLYRVKVEREADYARIPHFPSATLEHHKGRLISGTVAGRKVLVMQGRFHFYEGHTMAQIVFPIRVMKSLGIRRLLLSNVAGGIHPDFRKGDLVLIDDHINLQSGNPLIGPNPDALGPRFPDMSRPYSPALCSQLREAARKAGVPLKQGVYAAVNGPMLETRAEYRYLRTLGADLVGMSTVPEVIAANHMGLPCAAISIVTDECDPENLKPIDVPEIIAIAGSRDPQLAGLFAAVAGAAPAPGR
jgi:purine-nucleoside phosphorylase